MIADSQENGKQKDSKVYWKTSSPPVFLAAFAYDPPAGYDYQWSGN
jgi:hypothetical protein